MIDSLAILLTTLAVLYVLVRARDFDRSLPWFETEDTLTTETGNTAKRDPTASPDRMYSISNEPWKS